jgi:hypothetical protein
MDRLSIERSLLVVFRTYPSSRQSLVAVGKEHEGETAESRVERRIKETERGRIHTSGAPSMTVGEVGDVMTRWS